MTRGPVARPWRLDLPLEPASATPLYRQLVQAIVRDIRRGRLRPGDALPGTRTLAEKLGITRKVVVTALDELVSQGWLVSQPARGTFVSPALPAHAVADAEPRRADVRQGPVETRPPVLTLNDGSPDARLAPLEALARAYRRALLRLSRKGLGYGDARGDEVLREVLSSFLNQARGLSSRPEQLVITRGSQMALLLAGKALVRPGEAIAVESPGYTPAWDAFRFVGAELCPVPVDHEGLRIDALERVLARGRVRAVYTTPHHQYPTTVSLSAARRLALLSLAAKHGFTIIEDDYDYEYYYASRPLLPMASTGELQRVVYIGSLSKLLAPGIRVGYLVANEQILEKAVEARATLDRQGDPALERAVAELLEDGELQRHARKARRVYEGRRDHLVSRLRAHRHLRELLEFDVPSGGLALWLRAREGVDVEAWSRRAAGQGLLFTPGSAHGAERLARQGFRAGYAALEPRELDAAVTLLGKSA
ncbi:PLP-dependent aminotransferase family protein [Stigmatella aurantiaca]|uniref:MocR-like pyridoxine biosynthesis transcription factor PdxR n=1 Tax=Stigmatella aurantiaca TaxID=41 RepID=UPI00094583D9|nr:PLP-dependent aminotransferase family protein [Stigmatella aurantiaca]